jgi:hypothetical protein
MSARSYLKGSMLPNRANGICLPENEDFIGLGEL